MPAITQTAEAVTATRLMGEITSVMASSPATWLRSQFSQLVDQIFYRKSRRPCARHAVIDYPGQLPRTFAFRSPGAHLLLADKRACSLVRLQQPSEFELAVSAHHGVGIDGQIDGELAHRGQLIADRKRSRSYAAAHLVDDLTVHGHAAMQVQPKAKWRPRVHP